MATGLSNGGGLAATSSSLILGARGLSGSGNGLAYTGAGATTFPSVTAVNAEGWSTTVTSPPTFDPVNSPKYVVVRRAGFDTSGNATTYTDNLILTQRVRQAYPNQGLLDPSRCAMTDYVYSTDTVTGVTNNSTFISPTPVANWVTPHRLTVGNTVNVEIVAFHKDARNSKQIACVIFSATDGTTTVTQTVSTPTVSGRTGDQNAVIVYAGALNITTLTDNHLITVNAKIYPWVGSAASVLDSSTVTPVRGSLMRSFTPRYFYKNTARFATPWVAYVNSAGNDSTGVASQTDATAFATPCLTMTGALAKLATAATNIDNCIIYISNTVATGTTFIGNQTQFCGALVVTRDSRVSRATAIVTNGANYRPFINTGILTPIVTGCIRFTDVTVRMSGGSAFYGEAAPNLLELIFDNCIFDNGSQTLSYGSGNEVFYHYGTTFQNVSTTALNVALAEIACYRGCTGSLGASSGPEMWLQVGNLWTTPIRMQNYNSASSPPTRTIDRAIFAFNRVITPDFTADMQFIFGLNEDTTGAALVQNLWEVAGTINQPVTGLSNDSPLTGNLAHIIFCHNTFTGFEHIGRENIFYDENASVHRNHTLMCVKANIFVQINTKSDIFLTDGTHTGNFVYGYSVCCRANFTQYINTGGAAFAQMYNGLEANYGTDLVIRNDPLFTNYQGTTNTGSTPVAGTGGGTYTLQAGTPCRGVFRAPILAFDLAGTARSATADSMGCYV